MPHFCSKIDPTGDSQQNPDAKRSSTTPRVYFNNSSSSSSAPLTAATLASGNPSVSASGGGGGRSQMQKTPSFLRNHHKKTKRQVKMSSSEDSEAAVDPSSLAVVQTSSSASSRLATKFTFTLKSKLDGCEIRAKLLESPCLKAAYLINNVECTALVKHDSSKITCFMNSHCLSFQCDDDDFLPGGGGGLSASASPLPRHMTTSTSLPHQLGSHQQQQQQQQQQQSPPKRLLRNELFETMHMKPLDERTNFFLPSLSLHGSHVSRHLQLNVAPPPTLSTTNTNWGNF